MNTTALVEQLKAVGEDFEFYPTTRDMVKAIWKHRRTPWSDGSGYNIDHFGDVLDIGCGTCNFKRWIAELNAPLEEKSDRATVTISQYYVMEKSRILLNRLDASTIVLGTDFHESTLIDKPVDTVFCNPPYTEYEDWAAKIITESVCKSIYLILPRRWKQSDKIKVALSRVKIPFDRESRLPDEERAIRVIGSFDFKEAERTARAKVDILYVNKEYTNRDAGFDGFFDQIFGMPDDGGTSSASFEYEERKAEADALKAELIGGRNKIEVLCAGYEAAQKQLFDHFKVICSLDAGILDTIGIKKKAVKEALKSRFAGLKNLYWEAAFDCLDEITSRLTSTSRKSLLERFTLLKSVEFTASNLYALVVWVIKNANDYTASQMIDFFKALSSVENMRNYASNKRVFERDEWRYRQSEKPTHYTLDYRIICTEYALPGDKGCSYHNENLGEVFKNKISDICTVANNLGFPAGLIDLPRAYGENGDVLTTIAGKEAVLFSFRCYQNRNVHVKFNMEFMKALNVEVARKLGWIHSAQDIAREFTPEMAKGAEKYFNRFQGIGLDSAARLMLPEQIAPDTPEQDFIDGILF